MNDQTQAPEGGPALTNDQLWASWLSCPAPAEGEDDSMEARVVKFARAVEQRVRAALSAERDNEVQGLRATRARGQIVERALCDIMAMTTVEELDEALWPIDDYVTPGLQAAYDLKRAAVQAPAGGDAQPNAKLIETLEAAKAGLVWYRDEHPEDASVADDEMLADIDACVAALSATQPKETPPVEAWRGDRKVTIYAGENVMCMQGEGEALTFVSDEPHTLDSAQRALDWLYVPSPAVRDEPIGYLSEHTGPEGPFKWQFSKTLAGVYRDTAIRIIPVFDVPVQGKQK